MSSSAPGSGLQLSLNWNEIALKAITTGLGEIPEIGGILGDLFNAFWPASGPDVWSEIQQNVQNLINQSLTQAQYQEVQTKLGVASQNSGLVGVLNDYLGAVNPNPNQNNGQDPEQTWNSANVTFIAAQSAFQQTGAEVLLLPLFGPFANMHLSLLRDGVVRGWVKDSELHERIVSYTTWAQTYYQQGYTARQQSSTGFNDLNHYVQQMQFGVMNFAATWPYFDTTQYPPPVTIQIPGEVFYTISGSLGLSGGNYGYPSANPDSPVTGIDVYWIQDLYDNYNLVQGTVVSYGSNQQPYSGILINGAVPPINKPCNPDNDYFCYFKTPVAVDPNNPIVSVSGVANKDGGTFCVSFGFQNGSSTAQIPDQSQTQQQDPISFNLAPPQGYYLSSIWSPSTDLYYSSAPDLFVGFRFSPKILS